MAAGTAALLRLSEILARTPEALAVQLVEEALPLCRAHSALLALATDDGPRLAAAAGFMTGLTTIRDLPRVVLDRAAGDHGLANGAEAILPHPDLPEAGLCRAITTGGRLAGALWIALGGTEPEATAAAERGLALLARFATAALPALRRGPALPFRDRDRLRLAEEQRRGRNTLALIRSLVRRTARSSQTVDDFAMHLDGRIDALARLRALVGLDPDTGVDLRRLVSDLMLPAAAREGEQYTLDGPSIHIRPDAAEALGLAVHELATNAIKFGALARPHGRIRVSWHPVTQDAEDILRLAWQETGVGPVRLGRRRGFGFEILEKSLAYELKARARAVPGPDGLLWTIDLPTDRLMAARPEPGGAEADEQAD